MKIIVEEKASKDEEDTIIIRCDTLDDSIMKLIHQLKSKDELLIGTANEKIARIRPQDVYYFESVDHKVFLYTEKDVYEIKQKLYEIEDTYQGMDYFRVSKSVILNLSKIQHLSPVLGSRLEATLLNGERIMISRQYVAALKVLLGI